MDFVVLAKVAIVAIFPNVAAAAIEERVVTRAIRELDTGEVSLRHGGLGLKDWFQCEHQKKQSDEREDRLCVKVNAHVSASNLFSASRGTSQNTAFLRPKARNHCKVIYSRVLGLLRSLSVRMGNRPQGVNERVYSRLPPNLHRRCCRRCACVWPEGGSRPTRQPIGSLLQAAIIAEISGATIVRRDLAS